MIDFELLKAVMMTYLAQTPLYIVWIMGIAISAYFFKKRSKNSILALIGICILFFNNLLFTFLNVLFPVLAFSRYHLESHLVRIITLVIFFIQVIFSTTGWIFIILALFSGKDKDQS